MGEEGYGFSKVVSDADTGTVLGGYCWTACLGPHLGRVSAVASASHVDDLTLTIHPHPTLPESIEEAAEQVEHRAIHIFNP